MLTPRQRRWRIARAIGILLMALILNAGILALPFDFGQLGSYGYLGIFVFTLLSNATVLVPLPYPAAVARAANSALNPWGVVVASAAGSVIGESLAFAVGRAGKGVVERNRVYNWVQRQLRFRMRAALVLFVLSAIPNPFFDVAGLTAGAMGLPYPLFVLPTFLGRIVKMLLFAEAGRSLL